MDCSHTLLLRCVNCDRVWCVPLIVGKAQVFHRHCGSELERELSPEAVTACTRGTVSYFRDQNRLEVLPDVGR